MAKIKEGQARVKFFDSVSYCDGPSFDNGDTGVINKRDALAYAANGVCEIIEIIGEKKRAAGRPPGRKAVTG